jgi:hypothetical protein
LSKNWSAKALRSHFHPGATIWETQNGKEDSIAWQYPMMDVDCDIFRKHFSAAQEDFARSYHQR